MARPRQPPEQPTERERKRHETGLHCPFAHAKPPPERVSRGVVAARFPSAVSLHRYVACHRPVVEYSCRRGGRACDRQLGWTLRCLAQRPAPSIHWIYRILPSPLAWRTRLDVDALPPQRFSLAALDGHRAGPHLPARRLRTPALALALASCASCRGSPGPHRFRDTRPVHEHPGRLAHCRHPCFRRPLLRLRSQPLGRQREPRGALDSCHLLVRSLAQLA